MRYLLVEDFDPHFDYSGAVVIPLNPIPLYEFQARGIPYRLMESFYDEAKLRAQEALFFYDQLEWFDLIDRFLQEKISVAQRHQLLLGRAYYNRIKYFTDAIIIQSYILTKIIETSDNEDKWVYLKREENPSEGDFSMQRFKFSEGNSAYAELLPLICNKLQKKYMYHFFPRIKKTNPKKTGWKSRLRECLPAYSQENLKAIRRFFYYQKWQVDRTSRDKPLRVLFLHSGSLFLDPVIRDCIQAGMEVFLYTGQKITELSHWRERIIEDWSRDSDPAESSLRTECNRAAEVFLTEGKDILEWVERKCGVPVTPLILPYFLTYLKENCFDILRLAGRFQKFFQESEIAYAVSHTNSDIPAKAAICAAQMGQTTQIVGIQHCCDAYEDRVMHMTELDPFDLYFTADSISEEKFIRYAQEPHIRPCRIFQSPHYLKSIEDQSRQSLQRRGALPDKTVLFLPSKLGSMHVRYFNCMVYPIQWYMDYQRQLFDFLAKDFPDWTFIYKKVVNWTSYVDHTLIPYLQKNCPNVRIETQPMPYWMSRVDAIIMDRPTTALYEAMLSEKPALALYPSFMENLIDQPTRHYFKKTLQSFDDMPECGRIIKEFLRQLQNPEYRPLLPVRDDSFVGVLQKNRNKQPSQMTVKSV